jgi:hypothetical protein
MFENLGKFIGATIEESHPCNLVGYEELCNKLDANYEDFGRSMAKVACNLFTYFGKGSTAPALHMSMLAHADEWVPEYNEHVQTAIDSMVKTASKNELVKQAITSWDWGAVEDAATLYALLAGAGIATGGLGGAAYWGLNRLQEQDKLENEELRARIEAYNQLVDEMETDLQSKYKYDEQEQQPEQQEFQF